MKTKIFIALVLLLVLLTLQWRRELMTHVMIATGTGAPPPLLDLTEEGPGVLWLSDYFTIELVAPDTYAIGEPRYAQQNYSYLIIGSDSALLFDAGPGVRDIRATAQSLTDKPITFLPSHFHYDHVGNNNTFDNIAVVDLPYLRSRAEGDRLTLTTTEHLGDIEGFDTPTWQVDHWWAPGQIIDLGGRTLQLLHTPGHTTDSISLWDEGNGLLFSGDYLYPGDLYGFLPNSSMGEYKATAETLLSVLPGGTRLLGAHRVAAPGAPWLEWRDLQDLDQGLQRIRDGESEGIGTYPQQFPINENLQMLAEPRWLQRW